MKWAAADKCAGKKAGAFFDDYNTILFDEGHAAESVGLSAARASIHRSCHATGKYIRKVVELGAREHVSLVGKSSTHLFF